MNIHVIIPNCRRWQYKKRKKEKKEKQLEEHNKVDSQVSKITENQKNMLQSFSEDEQRFAWSAKNSDLCSHKIAIALSSTVHNIIQSYSETRVISVSSQAQDWKSAWMPVMTLHDSVMETTAQMFVVGLLLDFKILLLKYYILHFKMKWNETFDV